LNALRLAGAAIVLMIMCSTPCLAKNPSAIDSAAARISAAIGKCWFAKGETIFAGFIYVPEIDAYVGPPRILLVPKKSPHGKPALVIEFSAAKRKIDVYGPLADTPKAARIQADIGRWAAGGESCS
jgi:hypothetical protein